MRSTIAMNVVCAVLLFGGAHAMVRAEGLGLEAATERAISAHRAEIVELSGEIERSEPWELRELGDKLEAATAGFDGTSREAIATTLRDVTTAKIKESGELFPRIIVADGTVVAGDFPHAVAFFVKDGPRWFQYCAGTLVAPGRVVTAAHCDVYQPEQVRVTVGVVNIKNPAPHLRPIERFVKHPHFKVKRNPQTGREYALEYDVAVAFLPVSGSPATASFAQSAGVDETGVTVRVIGWGDTDPNPAVYVGSTKLNYADVELVSATTCRSKYAVEPDAIGAGMFCSAGVNAAGKSQDTCQGDSGGGLFRWSDERHRWELLGITSFGWGCADPSYPGVYTHVPTFAAWIANPGAAAAAAAP